jgi:RNA polymerase sigma-70 factor (ECF subfamily)
VNGNGFQTTRWSLLRSAGAEPATARAALEELCRSYRPPVLAFLRACGHSMDEAEDLTQAFFLRFLDLRLHQRAHPERGRFRVFLRTAVRNFVANERESASAQRRRPAGFGQDLDLDQFAGPSFNHPDAVFERAFALTVVDQARRALQREAEARGRGELYATLSEFLAHAD